MITYAYLHKAELEKLLAEFQAKPEALYYSPNSYINFECDIENNTWNSLQLVAIHNSRIQGYLKADINRICNTIYNVSMCKFCSGHELEFAADLTKIMRFLRSSFRVVRWHGVVGSPNEAIYIKIAFGLGGSVVGHMSAYHKLRDGRIVDAIFYEVPGVDYGTKEPTGNTVLPANFAD